MRLKHIDIIMTFPAYTERLWINLLVSLKVQITHKCLSLVPRAEYRVVPMVVLPRHHRALIILWLLIHAFVQLSVSLSVPFVFGLDNIFVKFYVLRIILS